MTHREGHGMQADHDEMVTAVKEALQSESIKFLLHTMASEAATKAINARLLDLSLDSDRESIEEFRDNMRFISNTRRRCGKVWDRVWNVVVGIIVAGSCAGAYAILKYLIPRLPG